jgi:oxygen-independent coproporphyrinogen-3 oxidase
MPQAQPGLYLHLPFCPSRCLYCHFNSVVYDAALEARYAAALLREVNRGAGAPEGAGAGSVYFGGGTPSLLPAGRIAALLDACRGRFRLSDDCEISLEANPGTLSEEKAALWRSSGVNRVSLGAQSFSDGELVAAGRAHTAAMTLEALALLRKSGFDNISLDLMLGLPQQTPRSWRRTLERAASSGVEHLSLYMLDLDEECLLGVMAREGKVTLPDGDETADLYAESVEYLRGCGFEQYEISNFSRPGRRSRHNLKYWRREPVLAFGAGACSFDGGRRRANASGLEDYCRRIESGRSPEVRSESVEGERALSETLFLSLRLTEGLDLDRLAAAMGAPLPEGYAAAIEEFRARGWIEREGSRVRLTVPGMLLSNEIFQAFV